MPFIGYYKFETLCFFLLNLRDRIKLFFIIKIYQFIRLVIYLKSFMKNILCILKNSYTVKIQNTELCTVDDKCKIGKCLIYSNSTKYCECPKGYNGEFCEKRMWYFMLWTVLFFLCYKLGIVNIQSASRI